MRATVGRAFRTPRARSFARALAVGSLTVLLVAAGSLAALGPDRLHGGVAGLPAAPKPVATTDLRCGQVETNHSSFRLELNTGFSFCVVLVPSTMVSAVQFSWETPGRIVTLVVLGDLCLPSAGCFDLLETSPVILSNQTGAFGHGQFSPNPSGLADEFVVWSGGCGGKFSTPPSPGPGPSNVTVVVEGYTG
jgi:hypothetical protein